MGFGIAMGLLASASWAAANIFIQRASRALGPFRALVWALFLGGLLLLPIAVGLDHRVGSFGGAGLTGWIVVASAASVVAYTSMFFAFERGRLSMVVPVMSSWSVIAAGISLIVFHQAVRRSQLAGAAAVVLGVLVIARFAQRGGADQATPGRAGTLGLSALTALGFGVLIPCIDRLAPALGQLGAVSCVLLVDLLLWLPLALVARLSVRPPPLRAWPVVLAAGAFETAGFVWISLGIGRAPVAVVSPFAGLSSAFTVIYAWIFLGERPARPLLVGAALVCAGVVILSL